jgi:mRNA interferase RelE/StbE
LAYRVVLTPAAQRQLDRLRGVTLIALRGVILALADEPRPPGSAKLAGRRNLRRLRVRIDGQPWRVVYQLDESEQLAIVTRIARRDEGTYRRL